MAARFTHGPVLASFWLFIVIGMVSGANGVLLPEQIDDYQVDKATIGLTFLTSAGGFIVASLYSGPLVHRVGSRTALSAMCALLVGSGLLIAARPPFVLFVLVQFLLGCAMGALDSLPNAYLAARRNATSLLNLLHAFFGVGALLGPLVAAWLLTYTGWRTVALVLALTALGPLVLSWLTFPGRADDPLMAAAVSGSAGGPADTHGRAGGQADADGAAGHADAVGAVGHAAARPTLGAALRQRTVLLGALLLGVYVGIEISLGTWGFSYLVEHHERSDRVASYTISGYWLGLTVGRLLIGPVTRWLRLTPSGLVTACLVGITVSSGLAWAAPTTGGLVLIAFAVVGFCLGPIFPTVIAISPRLTSAHLVATAIGVLNAGALLGGALLPWLAGTLLQTAGPWTLFPYAMVLGVAQLAIWRALAPRLRRDDAAPAAAGPHPVPAVLATEPER
ncbi:MAG: MFS transporter [Frankia sp.]|nr:MFS transporter [Frankia sp.]